MNTNKLTKHVVAGLIFHDNKLFAAMRSENDERFEKYEFPGGKKEENETSKEALVREIKEELELGIEVGPLFTHLSHEYDSFFLEMDVFVCYTKTTEFKLNVHKKAGFYNKADIANLDFLDADIKLVADILASKYFD